MNDLLNETPLSQLVTPNQRVVRLEHNLSIGDALKVLAENRILSAPMVLLPDIEDGGDLDTTAQLLGWVDVGDIMKALLSHLSSKDDIPSAMLALMTSLEREGPVFASKTLVTVPVAEDRGLLFEGDSDSISLMTAIREVFVKYTDGKRNISHRIALFDAHGDVTTIISQMDVIRWILHQNVQDDKLCKSISELGMLQGKPPVFSVNPHTPTLVAYGQMSAAEVSGAPVVNDAGEVIANLSMSDVRALTSEHFGVLALPVAEFLALEHNTAYLGYSVVSSKHSKHPFFASSPRAGSSPKKGDIQVFAVTKDTSLQDTLSKFVSDHIHRVYVIDNSKGFPHVEAVLTLTDVLQYLAGVW